MDYLIPSLADIFDILIVAMILYGILRIMRRTTAIEIVILVLLLFVLYFLATIYDLNMILGILHGIQNYWILIIVIIFQSEIKNLISQLSKNRSLLSLFKNPVKFTISTILYVVTFFSDRKIGALLVFERNHSLDNFISTGEIIDAKLSSKLLISIFNTSNILHDGAVVVRDDRVYAAKVVMPLSKNEEYARSYGTRHLAAIGITEVSDAFCIVVSEQTGRISFAEEGKISLDLSAEELLQILTDETKQ